MITTGSRVIVDIPDCKESDEKYQGQVGTVVRIIPESGLPYKVRLGEEDLNEHFMEGRFVPFKLSELKEVNAIRVTTTRKR